MSAEELHQQVAALLAGGGDMAAQFADVEAKLARWVAGVRAAQTALAQAPTAASTLAPEPAPPVQAAPPAEMAPPETAREEPRRASKLFTGQSPVPDPAPRVSADKSSPPGGTATDDDALLASLPPQVANAIRIKRRLGNRKPLRELLAEINLEPPAPEPDVRKRTWWRRGDD